MRAFIGIAVLFGALPMLTSSPAQHSAIDAAVKALGANGIRSLQFTASGATFTVGQNFSADDPWPRIAVRRYVVLVDYEHARMRQELIREMGPTMPRGGGVPFTGELHQIQLSDADSAWDIPVSADSSASSLPVTPCTPPEAGGTAPRSASAPASRVPCALMLWATPHGFLKAALAHHATITDGRDGTVVSFTIDGRHKMTGIINAHHQVTRVQAWTAQSIVGDMLTQTDYGGYRDFGGVQFPSRIIQTQDGFPSLDLSVDTVALNVSETIAPPDEPKSPGVAPPIVESQQVAEGVFWLTGGTHHSLAIAMRDHIVLVDTPNGEARASAVIAKAKELMPGKPIRYVIATHHHWDHLGGIRTAIDEGATIVTHRSNQAFLERAATAPHTIAPDRLSASRKPLRIQTVNDEATLTDGTRVVKLHRMIGFDHAGDMLVVYLPKEKVLAEADAYSPPETPTTPLIAPKVPYAAALYDNIRRLRLDVQTIVPFHGMRTADLNEVKEHAMTAEDNRSKEEAAIRALVEGFVGAIRAKDIGGVMSVFATDVVSFDLGPPLQHGGGDAFMKRWQEMFESYQGAIDYEVRDLRIAVGADVAFSHSLNRMGGTMKNGQRSDRWLRWTACYRKTSGGWRIVHEQVSVPVDVRNGTAILDLTPP